MISSTSEKDIYEVFKTVPVTFKCFSVKRYVIKQEIMDIGEQQVLQLQFPSFILRI